MADEAIDLDHDCEISGDGSEIMRQILQSGLNFQLPVSMQAEACNLNRN